MIRHMGWFFGGIGLALLVGIVTYNGCIDRRNTIRNVFAPIDIQLKKRWSLIPNLSEPVKVFVGYGKVVLESVVTVRNRRPKSGPAKCRHRWSVTLDGLGGNFKS